ncbi:hypothetical protein OS493_021112 [Desmophyllum pertusum]|uniref:G-protein coupled receptors family 1 profile domain-containing protein n=1 Tax=Desmophyllum pertusum TaxID=174260 RepID=A0A9W9ZMK8_9CNID|nr:hypothetical protein OS493_021112 [Desmophyllum pertusum]
MIESIHNSSSHTHTEGVTTTLSEAERNFKIVFYCFLFIFGSLGNVLVIVVVKGKGKRTINDYFILNLAVSDLTFLWFSLPIYTYELFHAFYKNVLYCKLIWPMMSVTLSVSVFTLTSMAIERCRGIINPLQPRIKLQATLVWILVIWIFAFVTIFPLMIVARSENESCVEEWPTFSYRQAYTAVLFAFQYVIPLIIIAIAYLRITIRLITSRLPMRVSVNARGHVIRQKTRSENVQITLTLAVIVILFVACMLPNQIAWMLNDFGGDSQKELSHAFWICAEALIFLHAGVNPIVYGSLTGQFRRGYVQYFRYLFCCRQTRLTFPEISAGNLNSGRHTRGKHSGFIVHGSLEYTSFIEKSKATQVKMQSSPDLSPTGGSNRIGNPSSGFSTARQSNSIEMLLTTTNKVNCLKAKAILNLSFSNSALDVSDEEQSVQDTKL